MVLFLPFTFSAVCCSSFSSKSKLILLCRIASLFIQCVNSINDNCTLHIFLHCSVLFFSFPVSFIVRITNIRGLFLLQFFFSSILFCDCGSLWMLVVFGARSVCVCFVTGRGSFRLKSQIFHSCIHNTTLWVQCDPAMACCRTLFSFHFFFVYDFVRVCAYSSSYFPCFVWPCALPQHILCSVDVLIREIKETYLSLLIAVIETTPKRITIQITANKVHKETVFNAQHANNKWMVILLHTFCDLFFSPVRLSNFIEKWWALNVCKRLRYRLCLSFSFF